MILLKGTIENGLVVLRERVGLPNGTEVIVVAHELPTSLGMTEEEWPTSREGIAQLVARMERVEPFEMTPAEEKDAAEWREKIKEYTLAHQNKAIEGLFE